MITAEILKISFFYIYFVGQWWGLLVKKAENYRNMVSQNLFFVYIVTDLHRHQKSHRLEQNEGE